MNMFSRPRVPAFPDSSAISRFLKRAIPDERQIDPILVHCHLSWDNVWQRPQQYLSRLAKWHPVLFVETEMRKGEFAPYYEHGPAAGCPRVTQLKMTFPSRVWSDGAYVDRERRRLLKTALLEPALRQYKRPIQWFYDPMAVTAFLGQMDESLVVYDCMDELSQFRGAPVELVQRERELLNQADLVFCGGNLLHQAKRVYHSDCHFFGCGVDVEHFGQALGSDTTIPDDIRALPKPIYGYYGVIDERLDYNLILKLAGSTTGSVVMLGPTAKIQAHELPQHPRLHWLGRRDYQDLPRYAKGFDVCLMPFALNEATEFINPTKALEYLASGRPVVSTAVPDVVSLFAEVVHVAGSHNDFLALSRSQAENPSRHARRAGVRRAEANTWDRLSAEIEGHLRRKKAALAVKGARSVGNFAAEPRSIS